jgi:hypothetical protein
MYAVSLVTGTYGVFFNAKSDPVFDILPVSPIIKSFAAKFVVRLFLVAIFAATLALPSIAVPALAFLPPLKG